MEWRCEWCGKPHEADDPPCDNCGHNRFEKAVVQQVGDSTPDSTVVWACTQCGREHTKHSPPCSRCGNATLERTRKTITEENLTTLPGEETVESNIGNETTTLWVCTQCGREHTKHSPPCSRCGSTDLQREQRSVSDEELSVPGYLDVLTPQYAAALVGVVVIAALFVLGFAGVVDLPFFPDSGVPEVENVPGDATESNGISLAAVENAYLSAVGGQQTGDNRLQRVDHLDEVATFYNQQLVRQARAGGPPPSEEEIGELLGRECTGSASVQTGTVTVDAEDTAESLGQRLADRVLAESDTPLVQSNGRTGVDIHSVENELFLVQFVCEG